MASCLRRRRTSLTVRASVSARSAWAGEHLAYAGPFGVPGVDVPKNVAFDLKSTLGAINYPKSRKLTVPYRAGAGAGSGVGRGIDASDESMSRAGGVGHLAALGSFGRRRLACGAAFP